MNLLENVPNFYFEFMPVKAMAVQPSQQSSCAPMETQQTESPNSSWQLHSPDAGVARAPICGVYACLDCSPDTSALENAGAMELRVTKVRVHNSKCRTYTLFAITCRLGSQGWCILERYSDIRSLLEVRPPIGSA